MSLECAFSDSGATVVASSSSSSRQSLQDGTPYLLSLLSEFSLKRTTQHEPDVTEIPYNSGFACRAESREANILHALVACSYNVLIDMVSLGEPTAHWLDTLVSKSPGPICLALRTGIPFHPLLSPGNSHVLEGLHPKVTVDGMWPLWASHWESLLSQEGRTLETLEQWEPRYELPFCHSPVHRILFKLFNPSVCLVYIVYRVEFILTLTV